MHARTVGFLGSCALYVTDDLFGCPLSAVSAFMERQVQAYGGTAASFLFVYVPSGNSDVLVLLGRCRLIMLYIACSEYEGFSFVYNFFGPIDAIVPVWKSSGIGHREILGESQSKGMKDLRLFETFWYQPLQVFLVSACFGIQGHRIPARQLHSESFATPPASSCVKLPQHAALLERLRISEVLPCAYCRCLRHCERLRWCQGVRGYYDVRAG